MYTSAFPRLQLLYTFVESVVAVKAARVTDSRVLASGEMGPTIILDKSAFQSFSRTAMSALYRHYGLVVPPILVKEILGNYTKPNKKFSVFDVLVRKFRGVEYTVNVSWRKLCRSELKGFRIPMDGRPVAPGTRIPVGGAGFVAFDRTPQEQALTRWLDGVVTDIERNQSAQWNESKAAIDLEAMRERFKEIIRVLPPVSSLHEIPPLVDRLFPRLSKNQLLDCLIAVSELTGTDAESVRRRWKEKSCPPPQSLYPYAFFCVRLRLIFMLSLARNLIGTRRTNLHDIEYLHYLPFCKVFCSGDELHVKLAPLLVQSGQREFIERHALRRDLEAIAFFWDSLTPDEQFKWADRFGHWPPTNNGSFTFSAWSKYWLPRSFCGNVAKRIPPSLRDSIIRELSSAKTAYRGLKPDKPPPKGFVKLTPDIGHGVEGMSVGN